MAFFSFASCRKLDSIFIQLEHLGFIKIDTVLFLILLALGSIILELHTVWKIYLPQEIIL